MKTDLTAKRVLFYGDSLVFGKVSGENKRLDSKTRFTGVVQDILGSNWEIIEEGLRARTLYGENSFFPERNGLEQFGPIVGSHLSIDVLVLFLGTNNANSTASPRSEDVSDAIRQYLDKLKFWSEFLSVSLPRLIIVLPPAITETNYDEASQKIFGEGAANKVSELCSYLEYAAKSQGIDTLTASEHCAPASGDGIHLDQAGNQSLAVALVQKIHAMGLS